MLPLFPTGMPVAEMEARVDRALQSMHLQKRRSARAGRISGGEQQRTAIARALVNEPTIIIADEPTAHLDSELSAELLDIFAELNRTGTTIIIATHDPRVMEHPIVSRRLVVRDGVVVEETSR